MRRSILGGKPQPYLNNMEINKIKEAHWSVLAAECARINAKHSPNKERYLDLSFGRDFVI